MVEDPGYVPKSGSRSQQKATINELLSLWKYDDQNFCVQCMLRTPLRSKHCKKCKRCVAKHDQYYSLQSNSSLSLLTPPPLATAPGSTTASALTTYGTSSSTSSPSRLASSSTSASSFSTSKSCRLPPIRTATSFPPTCAPTSSATRFPSS